MSTNIAIIDYQMGNLRSVQKAIEHAGGTACITSDPKLISAADKVILPGVGAFGDCMKELRARGLVDAIHDFVRTERPFLGICLGLQVLFDFGDEGVRQPGLGIIPGEVVRFQRPQEVKVPHMGWNVVLPRTSCDGQDSSAKGDLLAGVAEDRHFYFVHSYYAAPKNESDIWLEADYSGKFCAAIRRGNLYATQFHPEKSQANGLQLLKNFIEL
jgi:imidazole glycerol-phosphate synthase subunit HisH